MADPLFVKYLFLDDVRRPSPAVQPDGGVVHFPNLETVSDSIRRLDGDKVRLVVLGEHEPTADSDMPYAGEGMVIGGGGENGLYVCTAGIDDPNEQYHLFDPANESQEWCEVMFGQEGLYRRKESFPLDVVLSVAIHFASTGKMDDRYSWKKQ